MSLLRAAVAFLLATGLTQCTAVTQMKVPACSDPEWRMSVYLKGFPESYRDALVCPSTGDALGEVFSLGSPSDDVAVCLNDGTCLTGSMDEESGMAKLERHYGFNKVPRRKV